MRVAAPRAFSACSASMWARFSRQANCRLSAPLNTSSAATSAVIHSAYLGARPDRRAGRNQEGRGMKTFRRWLAWPRGGQRHVALLDHRYHPMCWIRACPKGPVASTPRGPQGAMDKVGREACNGCTGARNCGRLANVNPARAALQPSPADQNSDSTGVFKMITRRHCLSAAVAALAAPMALPVLAQKRLCLLYTSRCV